MTGIGLEDEVSFLLELRRKLWTSIQMGVRGKQGRSHDRRPSRMGVSPTQNGSYPIADKVGVWWDLKSHILSILGDTDTPGMCSENHREGTLGSR